MLLAKIYLARSLQTKSINYQKIRPKLNLPHLTLKTSKKRNLKLFQELDLKWKNLSHSLIPFIKFQLSIKPKYQIVVKSLKGRLKQVIHWILISCQVTVYRPWLSGKINVIRMQKPLKIFLALGKMNSHPN